MVQILQGVMSFKLHDVLMTFICSEGIKLGGLGRKYIDTMVH